ncbi:MAG: adenine nucleotide alpha hydrolase family protein [Acidobacteriaceae bacterium]
MRTLRVLSLGAGVQSTALLLMAMAGEFGDKPECAIFADTGWEPEGTYKHLDWLIAEGDRSGIPVVKVTAGNLREDLAAAARGERKRSATPPVFVRNDGPSDLGPYPGGRLWRQCTKEYKLEPIHRQVRLLLGAGNGKRLPPDALCEMWMGISADEAQRMKTSRDNWIVNRYPLVDAGLTRRDCMAWLTDHGYPIPPKSSCIGCPFHTNTYWRDMKMNRPGEFEDAAKWDEQIRTGLPGVTGKAFVHREMIPLREVDLRNMEDKIGQTLFGADGFGAECEGMCGV